MKAYFLHTRPQSFPVTFFAAFTGYALSPNKPHELSGIAVDLGMLFLIFSVLLWGGTNAFNSSQDGNDGPLTLLPDPPPVPKYLSAFGLALMGLAVLLAAFLSTRLAFWTAVGALLSILYSWKNNFFTRGKDIPVLDMLINTVGFGLCSILFGYIMTPAPVTATLIYIGIGFTFAYQGGMPTSQIFQLKKDSKPNYTSLLGAAWVLRAGAFFFVLHIVFLALAYTDLAFLSAHQVLMCMYAGWALLVLLSAIHSLWWSGGPFNEPYKKMNLQMVMMMSSQILWTVYAWMKSNQ